MTGAIVKSTSINALGSGPSVLGEARAQIPVGGRIRAGIKVLTPTAVKHPKAKAIYDAGIAAGKTFKEIEKELTEQCGFERSPLMPKNVPYFTVRRRDFVRPEAADELLRLYATDGPHGRQLYRFPIIFPMDTWLSVLPHRLGVYRTNEIVYWSEYDQSGNRWCMTHAPVTVDPKAKRATRVFGGRPIVPRAENDGRCEPAKCPEYQAGECKLRGQFLFYVPGVPTGSSVIAVPTTSFYGMNEARLKLQMVQMLTGGRISGTFDGKPVFFLTKKEDEVSMIDPATGKAKRVKQWIVSLEADIDMTRVFQGVEQRALLAAGAQATAALEHHEPLPPDETGEEDEPRPAPPPPTPEPTVPATPTPEHIEAIKAQRRKVFDGLQFLGLDIEQFVRYGTRTWGEGWSTNMEALTQADALLRRIADNNDVDLVKEIEAIGGLL